jgi:predicted restriction endonuclease
MKTYWQPQIDNWILKENDAGAYDFNINSRFGGDAMAGGTNAPIPVKSEEEEEHDKLKTPYKGITTLKRLSDQINQILEDMYGLSKTDKEHKDTTNPYEKIIQMLNNPDLKAMLEIASEEIKQKNLSSF